MREKPYSSEIPLISLEVTFQIKILSKLIAETRFLQNVWYKCVSLRFPNLVSYAKNVGAKNTFLRAEPTRSLMFYREICFVRLQKLPEKVFAFYNFNDFLFCSLQIDMPPRFLLLESCYKCVLSLCLPQ